MSINIQSKPQVNGGNRFNKINYSMGNMTSINQSNLRPQNNTLVDANYGNLLVKTNKISFTGLPDVIPTLSKKIGAGVHALKSDEILLVGNGLKKSVALLEESICSFNTVLKKMFFIDDPNIEETIAFYKNDKGIDQLINLNNNSLRVDAPHGEAYFVKKGENCYIETGDIIRTKNEPLDVALSFDVGFTDIKKNYIKQFNLTNQTREAVVQSNIKNLAKISPKEGSKAAKRTFADVGGQDAAIQELKKGIIYPLKFPAAYKNSTLNHGIILTGGPGTGKSLVAEVLANEADAHYIKLNGLDLESKWVGQSEENWRKLFKEAVDNQPSIIFIDEFDAVAKTRKGSDTSGNSDKVVNQILTLMSDLEKNNDQVFVVAATNKLSQLDSAITRSGRFGKHIPMEKPDLKGCKKILEIHTKNKPISAALDMDKLSEDLYKAKASGADIEFIANEAHQHAFNRLNIFEKMENDTFADADIKNLKIEPEDFKKALDDFATQEKINKESSKLAQNTRKNEIKVELLARRDAEKELAQEQSQEPSTTQETGKKTRNIMGFGSDRYKK